MEQIKMKAEFFIPSNFNKGNKCVLNLVLCSSLLFLSGCLTTGTSAPLAPTPPAIDSLFFAQMDDPQYKPHYFAPASDNVEIALDINSINGDAVKLADGQILSVKGNGGVVASIKDCRFKDRFDRKAVVAYEWNRSRVAFDVDGVNFDSGSSQGFMLKYKLRFQPEKTKKQRCRFQSGWQGLIGSAYNEFIVREENTALDEINNMRRDVSQYMNSLF